jgi:hypothetical protein
MPRHPRARFERTSRRGQLMGGTFDEVPIGYPDPQYVACDRNGVW